MGPTLRHFFSLLLIIRMGAVAVADVPKGSIGGVVTDQETGEPLAGVNVIIKNTHMGAVTDLSGEYAIRNVAPGKYDLSIMYIGYTQVIIKGVRVAPWIQTSVDVDMQSEILAGSYWGDAVRSKHISNFPSHLPLISDSVYMVVDTLMRGKYTVPIYIVNTSQKSWRIPTVDWKAWITPVVSKKGESFEYIFGRSSSCGNSARGSTLPPASYEIYRHPFRSQENPTDSIHYVLELSEHPPKDKPDGESIILKSVNFPGTISDFELDQALWGREHLASLSQQELKDLLHNRTEIIPGFDLRAKTGAVDQLSLYRNLIWLGGLNKLKHAYHNSRFSSIKVKQQFLYEVELELKLKYLRSIRRELELNDFPETDQSYFHQMMIRLEDEAFWEKYSRLYKRKEFRHQMQTRGLSSNNEYLRAAAVRYLFDAQASGKATSQLYQILKSESSKVVRMQVLKTLGNKQHAPAGDSLKVLLEEIAKYNDPQLRAAGYTMLARISENETPAFVSTYLDDQLSRETAWNKSTLLINIYYQDSLDTRTLQILSSLANSSDTQTRRRLSSLAYRHLKTLFDRGLEEDPQSEVLLEILSVLAVDDVKRIQRDVIGISRFGMHDERVMRILLRAQADMKSDFPKDIAKKIEEHQARF